MVLRNRKKFIFKNCLTHLKREYFSVLRQKQSCSHGVKNGFKNLQLFSFRPLKPFCLSSEQGLNCFFLMTKKSRQKFKCLENEQSFLGEIKAFFIVFEGLSLR